MLLGLNKEDVKNARKIESKSILTVKMSFSEVYSWSYSRYSGDYSKVIPELSQRTERGELLDVVTPMELHAKRTRSTDSRMGPSAARAALDPGAQLVPLVGHPKPASALSSSNWQQQRLHFHPRLQWDQCNLRKGLLSSKNVNSFQN